MSLPISFEEVVATYLCLEICVFEYRWRQRLVKKILNHPEINGKISTDQIYKILYRPHVLFRETASDLEERQKMTSEILCVKRVYQNLYGPIPKQRNFSFGPVGDSAIKIMSFLGSSVEAFAGLLTKDKC